MRKLFCIFFFLYYFGFARAQTRTPLFPDAYTPLLSAIYNQKFTTADSLFEQLEKLHPQDQALQLLKAYEWKWQYFPLQQQPDSLQALYAHQLKQLISLSEDDAGPKAAFLHMVSQLFVAEFYYNSKAYLKAFQYGSSAYGEMKAFIKDDPKTGAELFISGMYNYYRQFYQESNGLYATMLFFFPSGDKEKGLAFLKECLHQSTYFQTEALSYLAHIYLHIENSPSTAYPFAKQLIRQYHSNKPFQELFAEVCLSLHQFQEAKEAITLLQESKNQSDQLKGKVLALIAAEQNPDSSKQRTLTKYQSTYEDLRNQKDDQQVLISLVTAGIARCYKALGDVENAKKYEGITNDKRKYDYPLTNF